MEEVKVEQPDVKVESLKLLEKDDEVLTRDALVSDVGGERPNVDGPPTLVKVGLFVHDITSLNDADQTFVANIRLTYR